MNLFSLPPSYEPHLDPARVARIIIEADEDRDHVTAAGRVGDNLDIVRLRVEDHTGATLYADTWPERNGHRWHDGWDKARAAEKTLRRLLHARGWRDPHAARLTHAAASTRAPEPQSALCFD